MLIMQTRTTNLVTITGVLLLEWVVFDVVRWLLICRQTETFQEAVDQYLSFFPAWINKPRTVMAADLAMAFIAGICFLISWKRRSPGIIKKGLFLLMIGSMVLCGWLAFSLL